MEIFISINESGGVITTTITIIKFFSSFDEIDNGIFEIIIIDLFFNFLLVNNDFY